MGKYKYDFVVKGSPVLLEAFTKELNDLGYKCLTVDGEDLHVFGHDNSPIYDSSCYGYFSIKNINYNQSPKNKLIYSLPSDWDEALKLAGEKREEENRWKVGQWLEWKKGTDYVYRVIEANDDFFKIEWWNNVERLTTSYFNSDRNFKLSTPNKIKTYLSSQLKLTVGDALIGVRPVKKGEYNGERTIVTNYPMTGKMGNSGYYNEITDTLYTDGYGVYIVYEKGVFCKKEDSLPKLHNYDGKIIDSYVTYGCKSVHKSKISKILETIKCFNGDGNLKITGIEFDGYLISVDKLNEINKNISSL